MIVGLTLYAILMHGRGRKGSERGAGNSRCDEFSLSRDLPEASLAVICFSSPGLPDGSMSPRRSLCLLFRPLPALPPSTPWCDLQFIACPSLRHYTNCTVCRPGFWKPKMGLEKNLEKNGFGKNGPGNFFSFQSAPTQPDRV